jgi:hypothetical protein
VDQDKRLIKSSRASGLIVAIIVATTILVALTPRADANFLDRLFGYDSYEECILDRLQDVTNNVAVNEIREACRNIVVTNRSTHPAEVIETHYRDRFGGILVDLRLTARNNSPQDWEYVKILYTEERVDGECPAALTSYIEGPEGYIEVGSLASGQIFVIKVSNFWRTVNPFLVCLLVYGYY